MHELSFSLSGSAFVLVSVLTNDLYVYLSSQGHVYSLAVCRSHFCLSVCLLVCLLGQLSVSLSVCLRGRFPVCCLVCLLCRLSVCLSVRPMGFLLLFSRL